MPRAKRDDRKSSAELDAEIEVIKKQLAEKQKASQAAKRREDAEEKQAREYEEAKFNREFVEMAQGVYWGDYEDEGQTVFEIIKALIRPPISTEP